MTLVYETLDLDYNDKELITKVYYKLKRWGAKNIAIRFSSSGNGVHFRYLINSRVKDFSRLVFDDERRYNADQSRSEEQRNILWSTKVYNKEGLKPLKLQAGDWYYGINFIYEFNKPFVGDVKNGEERRGG